MCRIIYPKKILEAFRDHGCKPSISRNDLLLIEELGESILLRGALDEATFYKVLKKWVSLFNQEVALIGGLPLDFDDLYTKYSEYIAALQPFILT